MIHWTESARLSYNQRSYPWPIVNMIRLCYMYIQYRIILLTENKSSFLAGLGTTILLVSLTTGAKALGLIAPSVNPTEAIGISFKADSVLIEVGLGEGPDDVISTFELFDSGGDADTRSEELRDISED